MTTLQIQYFQVRGRLEYIRTLLAEKNVTFEEINCGESREKWMSEWKPKMKGQQYCMGYNTAVLRYSPFVKLFSVKTRLACEVNRKLFGQTPCLIDGDFKLYQSNAILRYLGRKYDLYGSNDKEAALIDMINDGVEDIRIQYSKLIYQNYEEGKDQYVGEITTKLQPFENHLKAHGGSIIGGDRMTFADYNLFDLLDIHQVLSPGCLDKLKTLKAYHARILAREGVQKRRQTENFKNMPINGNGKQ